MNETLSLYLEQLYLLSLDAAPWLLLGLLIAGLIKSYIPAKFIEKQLKPATLSSAVKGVAYGVPLPLCSCSVLPVALGLKRNGASNAATNAFLVSTPTTGVDSIAVSYALLGPIMAVARPIAAAITGILAGIFSLFVKEQALNTTAVKSCCKKSCASGEEKALSPLKKLSTGLIYAFTDLFADLKKWLLIGLFIAGAVQTFVPAETMAHYGQGIGAMFIAMLIGFPMYICATASTPIAASLLLTGVSPGTVLVFLLAGPACNAATLGVIKKEMGTGVLIAYLLALVIGAIGSGLTLDYLINNELLNFEFQSTFDAHDHQTWYSQLSLGILVLLAISPWQFFKNNTK
ncbi:SO_0444 family Cu/Zn efflux transporter [Catenovulum sp. SM1970]|uniref:SO_0444 family Cu/Zn efflux transporter n=1 Tax=Marinifaba aquimaris TaxID=2741323 RepID=UPI001573F1E8|nr:SO_0444 family Cu/Zn efflux transporter [Marinifaba aquimaris]NTS76050.1 SO_0444 family Cu/Zn efflux transporter [Marinifaba aquimaris]